MAFRVSPAAVRACLGVSLLVAAAAASLSAQSSRLRKTDLIRLLASGRPPGNVALQVRRRCLAFTPSPRDRFDLVAAGADAEVLAAIDGCAAQAARAAGALRVDAPQQVRAAAGSEVTFTARLMRGSVPQPGKPLQLRGATTIPGGSAQEPGAVTDARGRATFRVLAGVQPGTHTLLVVAVGDMPAQATVRLVITEPSLVAEVSPPQLVVQEGSRAAAVLRVTVRGRGGAPVATLPLELRGVVGGAALAGVAPVETDGTGSAVFIIPGGRLRGAGSLGVYARGVLLGTVGVRVATAMISDERTQFIGGTGQRGSVARRWITSCFMVRLGSEKLHLHTCLEMRWGSTSRSQLDPLLSVPGIWLPSLPISVQAIFSSLTKSIASTRPLKNISIRQWKIFSWIS